MLLFCQIKDRNWRVQASICYNSITLELIKERNLVLESIQENSIENSIQDNLPYILIIHSPYSTTLAYPK